MKLPPITNLLWFFIFLGMFVLGGEWATNTFALIENPEEPRISGVFRWVEQMFGAGVLYFSMKYNMFGMGLKKDPDDDNPIDKILKGK